MNDDPPRQGRRTPLGLRLLGVVGAALLLLALVVAISRERADDGEREPTSLATPAATASPATASPAPSPAAPDLSVLADPDAAQDAGADAVLAAARWAATDQWSDLVHPEWASAVDRPFPVYVGTVDVADGAVAGDLAIALPGSPDGPARDVALRFLPGAAVLVGAAGAPVVEVTVDGVPASHAVDEAGALLRVDLPGTPPRQAVLVRVRFTYDVAERGAIVDDGGPAGFGILARSPGLTLLGHGLPVLTFDDGPMVPWGDVGAFPAATWSLTVRSDGPVVTGGVEGPCPDHDGVRDCTRARGVGLRDLAIAVLHDGHATSEDGPVTAHGRAGTAPAARLDALSREGRASLDSLVARLGPLPWPELDLVLAPLTQAAGMEFPGLVVVDPEYLDRLDGGFGSFVVAHEVAHQWFHALVGNSSLADPVVDESLAQYTSLWVLDDLFGEAVADRTVDRYLLGRYRSAVERGVREQAPASPLADFGGNDVYGPMTYARGAWAWVALEGLVGREAVASSLAEFVDLHAFGVATVEDLLAHVRGDLPDASPLLAEVLTSPERIEAMLR